MGKFGTGPRAALSAELRGAVCELGCCWGGVGGAVLLEHLDKCGWVSLGAGESLVARRGGGIKKVEKAKAAVWPANSKLSQSDLDFAFRDKVTDKIRLTGKKPSF